MSPDDAAQHANDASWALHNGLEIAGLLPFAKLTGAQMQEVLASATVQRLTAGANVFAQGDRADHFYLLLDGVARIVQTTPEGEQIIVLHVMPGKMFGIAPAYENDTYHTTARVVVSGVALCWPSEMWDRFTRDYPGFLSASRQTVGERVEGMQSKIVSMATHQVEQRIAQAILTLVRQAGLKTPEGIEIGFPITRQDISEMTGTTLHSVSRYMSKWQKNGIVTSKRRRIIVRQPDALPV